MIRNLEWDSHFWGFPVGHLETSNLSVSSVDSAVLDEYTVVQSLIDLNQPSFSKLLATSGFFPIDTRIEYQLKIDGFRDDVGEHRAVRVGHAEDVIDASDAEVFASELVNSSRFSSFPTTTDHVIRFYATWIMNAQRRVFDDGLMVATIDKTPVALISYREREDGFSIGVIAVHPSYQGQGIARKLIYSLIALAQERKQSVINVVTEGCNIGAQRFYESTGFRVSTARLWMYRIHE